MPHLLRYQSVAIASATTPRTCFREVLAALAISLCSWSCGADAPRECLGGEPRPIFRPSDSTVVAHDFRADGQASVETVAFGNGLLLAFEQTGCDTLVRDFTLAHDSLAVAFPEVLAEVAGAFYALSGLAPRLRGLGEYGRLLSSVPAGTPEGAPVDLAPGLTVRVSGLPTPNRPSWRIRITEDLGAPRPPQ